MKKRTIFQRVLISGGLLLAAQMFSLPAAIGMQGHEDGAQPSGSASIVLANKEKSATPFKPVDFPRRDSNAARSVDEVSIVKFQKIDADKITSLFVRANDSKRIQLSMLVAHRAELTAAVQQIFGQKVTPLVFSVSTLPNRSINFDPALLRFEQRGRIWQPMASGNSVDLLPLDENTKFGGLVTDGEVHQGIVLLPAWFDPKEPITLRYGDFHYLARFVDNATQASGEK